MSEYDEAIPVIRELNVVLKKAKSDRSKEAIANAIETIEYLSVELDGMREQIGGQA